ncbi:hypothetical protein ACEN2O_14460 [Flavobacterium sp. W21_SRS_FM7]
MPKTYISKWIKLDFFNCSNLKYDIQNRISSDTQTVFIDALNNMKGDNRSGGGIPFSEITLLAMAYFYSEIFKDKIKDNYYTIDMVKGFLDASNLTQYTAIHEIDVKYYKLQDAYLFKHCWLIIQCAWFFNSEYFGHHQHIDYINNYIKTGRKLSVENYNYDRDYLLKKYNDVDKAKNKECINGFALVNQWYYLILFLVCKELNLSLTHFKCCIIDNREYNPLPKSSRQLRCLTPFKLIECDIKSAFPTFLDIETDATLKDRVYQNLMDAKGIARSEAKVLFNKVCNSGKYKSKEETIKFFLECGYTNEQCNHIITLTHNTEIKFFSSMAEYESFAIDVLIKVNNLQRGARLHDAILFIDDKVKPAILRVEPNCDFGYKELNKPVYRETFSLSDTRLKYEYISSIPKGLSIIDRTEPTDRPQIKGEANGFIFYKEKFSYYSSGFNLNDYRVDYQEFLSRVEKTLSTLQFLNEKPLTSDLLYTILLHIRANSQYVFNVKAMFLRVSRFKYSSLLIAGKQRDYKLSENIVCKKRGDFAKARSEALKVVTMQCNFRELFCYLQERITIDDYSYLDEIKFKGQRGNHLLIYKIVQKFNFLCTGKARNKQCTVKNEPLYNTPIKSILIKSLSLKQQQQNAFVTRQIRVYEKSLMKFNELINNRTIAKQLFLILCDISGQKTDLEIKRDDEVIERLKLELIKSVSYLEFESMKDAIKEFDKKYKTILIRELKPISDLSNVFDTDMSKSIFNHISIEEAYNRGEVFFIEYCEYHQIDFKKEVISKQVKTKGKFKFPELDF